MITPSVNKLNRPSPPKTMIDRVPLYQKLDQWQSVRAIAIHAPAGYGKSSLVSRWIEVSGNEAQSAWLSLHESDAEPRQFVQSISAALDPLVPGLLHAIQPVLKTPQSNPQRMLTKLLTILHDTFAFDGNTPPADYFFVLDDIHLITDSEAASLLTSILEEAPSGLHFILLTRHATTLSLSRLFAGGRALELTTNDLRFTSEEVRQYLQSQRVSSSMDECVTITQRIEGWIVALQLALHSLRGHGSLGEYLGSLRGDSRWLAQYLTHEVLDQQRPELRRFLLRTSVLDSFSASLCATVAETDDAYALLTELRSKDLFLIPLDADGLWFRYHHLFQELLIDKSDKSRIIV